MFMHSTGSGTRCQGDFPILKWVKGWKFDRSIPAVFLKIPFWFTVGATTARRSHLTWALFPTCHSHICPVRPRGQLCQGVNSG